MIKFGALCVAALLAQGCQPSTLVPQRVLAPDGVEVPDPTQTAWIRLEEEPPNRQRSSLHQLVEVVKQSRGYSKYVAAAVLLRATNSSALGPMVDSDAIAAVCESCVDVFPDRGVFTAEGIAKVPDGAWAMPINIRFEVRFDGHTLPLACPTPKGWKVRVEMATLDGDVRIRDDAFNDDWLRAENSLADLPKAKLIGVHKWTASVQFKAPNGRTATIRREWKFEVAPAQELMGMK